MGSYNCCLEIGICFNYDGTSTKCKGASCYFWNGYSCRVIGRKGCTDHTDELISCIRNHIPNWMGYEILHLTNSCCHWWRSTGAVSGFEDERIGWVCNGCTGSTDTYLKSSHPDCTYRSEEWWILPLHCLNNKACFPISPSHTSLP